jgi:hypothetical protein
MICPKCGFEQPEGPECLRCGIVIAKYHGPVAQPSPAVPPPLPPAPAAAEAPVQETLFSLFPETPPAPPPPPFVQAGEGRGIQRAPVAGGPFESGALLGEAFRIYFANFLPFVILTAVAFAPLFYLALFPPSVGSLQILMGFGTILCTPVATAAVTYGVFQHMRRRDASVGDCLRVGLSCLFPVLFVAILQALATGVGVILCIIPGILVAIMLAVAVPVAVEERPGVIAALNRSSELTDGYRWQIFGVLFLLGLINFAFGLLVIPLSGGLSGVRSVDANTTRAFLLTSRLIDLVPTGLSATASAVMYYRLRSIKESIDVEEIASVFD